MYVWSWRWWRAAVGEKVCAVGSYECEKKVQWQNEVIPLSSRRWDRGEGDLEGFGTGIHAHTEGPSSTQAASMRETTTIQTHSKLSVVMMWKSDMRTSCDVSATGAAYTEKRVVPCCVRESKMRACRSYINYCTWNVRLCKTFIWQKRSKEHLCVIQHRLMWHHTAGAS